MALPAPGYTRPSFGPIGRRPRAPGGMGLPGQQTAQGGAPSTTRNVYQGIGAGQTRTGVQTLDYLGQTFGTPLTAAQQQEAGAYINYTDATGNSAINHTDYNRLMQRAAERSGGTYSPYTETAQTGAGSATLPTEGALTPDPFPQTTVAPAPAYAAPRYNQQAFRPPTFEEMVASDPTYARRLGEGLGAAESRAAARGMLGTGTHVSDLNKVAQDYASDEFRNFYDRKAGEYGMDTAERRYGHESDTGAAQTEYAPRLLTWNRQEDQNQRGRELTYDRSWQRETYGRDDNYRRNRSGEDDYRYRNNDRQRDIDREESRRRFLAELGSQ